MKRELPIVQKTYDLVKWYVPILNKLPREHKFLLGDSPLERLCQRLVTGLDRSYPGSAWAQLPRLCLTCGELATRRFTATE